jgi:RNA polymerase sigma-70 factor, ECF subfamily
LYNTFIPVETNDDITELIVEWQGGNRSAESALFEKLYARLHKIAAGLARNEYPNQTLGPTALVHEAYVRFCGSSNLKIVDRAHFLALAARVMRRLLVDRARARRAQKRTQEPPLDTDSWFREEAEVDQVIAVDRALDALQERAPRQCRLVELRYFGGYTIEESAAALSISARHARREWDVARIRLKEAIDGA